MSSGARRFRRAWLVAVALGLVGTALPRAAAPAVPQHGGNKTVFAVALDASQRPVTDLAKREWGVREDGADRVIVDLKPATEPLDLVLMVDTSSSIQPSVTDLRIALLSFVRAIFKGNPDATISVMDVAGAAVMVANRARSAAALDTLLSRTFADQTESTVFLEGLVDASKMLAKSPSPRRAIVMVSLDGIPESSSVRPPKVIDAVVASGASLWAVTYQNAGSIGLSSAGGGIGPSNNGQNRDAILNKVPPGTGGVRMTITVSTALELTLGRVAAALLGQYAVTYTRPEGPMPTMLQMGQVRNGVKIIYPATPPR